MKIRRKKNGLSRTKSIKHAVREKRISNRSTGNTVRNSSRKQNRSIEDIDNRLQSKLTVKGFANLDKVKKAIASRSFYARSDDFSGKGLLVEVLAMEPRDDKDSDFGPGVTIKFLNCKTNKEQLWSTSSIGAIRIIVNLIERGITRMHIRKTGRDRDTRYHITPAEKISQKARISTHKMRKKFKR